MTSDLKPFVSTRDAEQAYWSLGGRFSIKAGGDATGERFAVSEAIFTKLAEPPPHVHLAEDEAWYVIEGGLTFSVGGEVLHARAGDFVFAPRGVAHTFTVESEPTRALVITSPSGFERFVADAGIAVAEAEGPLPIDPAVIGPLQSKYGIEILAPPHEG
jgi:quercetin dioxygenase-like cupin family protein